MILLSVLTSPRPIDYLTQTIEAIDANGSEHVDEKWILTDGIAGPLDMDNGNAGHYSQSGWDFRFNRQRTGNRLAMWRVFYLAQERDADWLIYCEDDIALADGAIEKVCQFVDPDLRQGVLRDTAFLTFYDSFLPELYPRCLTTMPCLGEGMGFWGALCFLMPRRTINWLCSVDPITCPMFDGTFHSGDCTMGWFLSRSEWDEYAIHVPTLVDHRGDASAVGQKGMRRGRNFAGQRDIVMTEPFYRGRK